MCNKLFFILKNIVIRILFLLDALNEIVHDPEGPECDVATLVFGLLEPESARFPAARVILVQPFCI